VIITDTDRAMVCSQVFTAAADCCAAALTLRYASHALLLLGLVGMSSTAAAVSSSSSSLPPADVDDDAFTFTEPGRSFVEYLQPPLPPPVNIKPEVGHVLRIDLEFRTLVGSASLLHRDTRRRLDADVEASPSRRHVTGCTRDAELRVQLKIGMLHVSTTYDEQHVTCVTVGQGKQTCDDSHRHMAHYWRIGNRFLNSILD